MLCLQNVKLENVVHCSASSIFFTPAESLALDFQVLSAVPSLHRPTLQRNGLIAKVFLCVSSTSPENSSATNMVRNSCNPMTQLSPLPFDMSKETLQSLSNRRCLWQNVLLAHNLIKEEALTTCTTRISKKLTWSILTEESFAKRVAFLQARRASAEVNASASCVPIIHINTMTSVLPHSCSCSSSSVTPQTHQQHQENNLSYAKVMLCVVWMPHYDAGLVSWCHTQRRNGERIHEATLIKLAQDLTIGLLALRTLRVGSDSVVTKNNATNKTTLPTRENTKLNLGVSNGGKRLNSITSTTVLQWIPSYLSTLHVLVVSERRENTSEPPAQFLLSSSMMESPLHLPFPLLHSAAKICDEKNNMANIPRNVNGMECIDEKHKAYGDIANYPFSSPEQILKINNGDTGSEVWALGMVVYALACLFPSPMELTRYIQQHEEHNRLPFNHPQLPPHLLVQRIWREMKSLSYSVIVSSVLCQLLSQDYRTRPSLSSINNTLYDLNRQPVILRFPFALGGFDLIRVAEPRHVQLNAVMCRYVTSDPCCVCKRPLNKRKCQRRDHAPGAASPSWTCNDNSTELLPGLQTRSSMSMCYLYPLLSGINAEEKRKYLRRAIIVHGDDSFCKTHDRSSNVVSNENCNSNNIKNNINKDNECEPCMSLDVTTLFQLIGGFAIYDWHKIRPSNDNSCTSKDKEPRVREVLIPFPAHALRESETSLAVLRVNFTAGLPWPPSCTRQLQEAEQHHVNRISNQIPLIFDGINRLAKWYAWILPRESFTLDNGLTWTPSDDGAFVFWFNENLQPSPLDRYFVMTSVRSSTTRYKVLRTVLAESAFRHRLGQDAHYSTFTHSYAYSMSRVESEREGNEFTLHRFSALNSLASTLRRRESQQMRLLEMPSSNSIIEDDNDTRLYGKANENEESISANLPQSKTNGIISSTNKSTCNSKKQNATTTTTITSTNTITADTNENNNKINDKVKSSNKLTANEINSPLQPAKRRGSKCKVDNITPDQVQGCYPETETIQDAVNNWQQLIHSYQSHTINDNTNGNNDNNNQGKPTQQQICEQKRSNKLSPLPQLEVEMLQEKANIPNNNLYSRHIFSNELEEPYKHEEQQQEQQEEVKNNRVNYLSPTKQPLHSTGVNVYSKTNLHEKGVQTENNNCNVEFEPPVVNNLSTAASEQVNKNVVEKVQRINTPLMFAATAPAAILHEAKNNAITQCKTANAFEPNTLHPFTYANNTITTEYVKYTSAKAHSNDNNNCMESKIKCSCNNGKSVTREHAEFMPLTDQDVEQALENIKAAHEQRTCNALQNAHRKQGNLSPEFVSSLEQEQLLPSELYKLKGALGKHSEWSSSSWSCSSSNYKNHITTSTSNNHQTNKLHEQFNALSIDNNGTHHTEHTHKVNADAEDVSVEHHVISWTPTLDSAVAPPIIGNMSLFAVYLVGKYYPASLIDAPFTSLTFVVVETGEHGMMQQPMALDKTLHIALKLPTSAKYLSFLSNAIPLLEHNHYGALTHTSCDTCVNGNGISDHNNNKNNGNNGRNNTLRPVSRDRVFAKTELTHTQKHILSHHGFAIFDAAGKAIALLALRVALCSPPLLQLGEFAIPLQGETPQTCETFVVERHMPSFFSVDMPNRGGKYTQNLESIASHEKSVNKLNYCETKYEVNEKCEKHNVGKAHNGALKSINVRSEQITNKDSKCYCKNNVDYYEDNGVNGNINDTYLNGDCDADDAMPCAHVELQQPCWMGFNHFSGQLLFSDVSRNYWFPFSIGSRRNAPVISAHTSLSSIQGCHLINVNGINNVESK